ncbi:hypothetical protein [Hansschlegelia zhihuaiae]|uniref:DUF4785 family protein n=1 Tax=Hansschlegelia zhihuaiae TaxID=405005 RepID=A0A4Q0MEW7_9HYPH|nr:hypothetical protein [Hansschlegelia zhihuaiae]RXF72021.1 hypothetical protein EK403_14460 [Hansschlegelia zhihuaiae]
MGRPSSSACAVAVLTAVALLAGSAGQAFAQSGPSGGPLAPGGMAGAAARSGPGARLERGFGGTISGRMNLIGPAGIGLQPPVPLTTPAPLAAPVLAPERIEKLDPKVLEQLKLPNLNSRPPARAETPREAALPPHSIAPVVKQPLQLSAVFEERGAAIRSGVRWRLFTEQADANGEHMLVAESIDASPRFELDPGGYIVHAVYGLTSAAKVITVKAAQPNAQTIVIPAGAVRLAAFVAGEKAPDDAVTFKLSRDEGGVQRVVAENVHAGSLLRLPAGAYHVTSRYGDANASVEADLQVAPGKLVEAQVHHKAARVALKLVDQPGGAELRDTSWTILTPGGDVIRDSIGALAGVVLAEGDYVAIARRDGRLYQQSFSVKAGAEANVEVSAN